MRILNQIALSSALALAGFGASYAQTNPQPGTVVKTVKVKPVKVKPPKQIQNKNIHNVPTKPSLTANEKASQKAFQKSNRKAAADLKKTQKAYSKNLREQAKQAKKSQT